jgi:hypothetical protein
MTAAGSLAQSRGFRVKFVLIVLATCLCSACTSVWYESKGADAAIFDKCEAEHLGLGFFDGVQAIDKCVEEARAKVAVR